MPTRAWKKKAGNRGLANFHPSFPGRATGRLKAGRDRGRRPGWNRNALRPTSTRKSPRRRLRTGERQKGGQKRGGPGPPQSRFVCCREATASRRANSGPWAQVAGFDGWAGPLMNWAHLGGISGPRDGARASASSGCGLPTRSPTFRAKGGNVFWHLGIAQHFKRMRARPLGR